MSQLMWDGEGPDLKLLAVSGPYSVGIKKKCSPSFEKLSGCLNEERDLAFK